MVSISATSDPSSGEGRGSRKVTALITRPGVDGPELLVFEHPLTGLQLPAGTVEEGESFAAAALREGWEETGALGLELVRELAVVEHPTRNATTRSATSSTSAPPSR